ncbi:MAG: ankyrin repeat domain-containing protein [Nitrospinota bacterium]|nr:ankyrin repeat domain-containing protein [Nitrospinota bacterium]
MRQKLLLLILAVVGSVLFLTRSSEMNPFVFSGQTTQPISFEASPEGWTWLHEAAENGDLPLAKKALEGGVNVNSVYKVWGSTPLHRAAFKGHADIVKLLLKRGADVHARDKAENTPIHFASTTEIAFLLINHGANPNQEGKYGSPIYSAASSGFVEAARVFLQHGNKLEGKGGFRPVHAAIMNGRKEMVVFLVEEGAKLVEPNGMDNLLHRAAYNNQVEIAKYLHQKGLAIDSRNEHKQTPLHRAAYNGGKEVAEWLISKGADVNARDHSQTTPLEIAATDYIGLMNKKPSENTAGLVRLLVNNGAEVNAKSAANYTPLHMAVRSGNAETVKFLLSQGAGESLMVKNSGAKTPLEEAIAGKNKAIIEIIKNHGT